MLEVITAAISTSFQDGGRMGYQCFGLPASGPMDWIAHLTANLLVGNQSSSACIELGLSATRIKVHQSMLLAVTGSGYRVVVDDKRELPLWTACWVPAGSILDFQKAQTGNWAYLAVNGGYDLDPHLRSCSTYLRAGLGQPIKQGDLIEIKSAETTNNLAGSHLAAELIPQYKNDIEIRITPTSHMHYVETAAQQAFWDSSYAISLNSDRMGYRLVGYPIEILNSANLLSQGMVLGAVQVPPDGQPIIMMADHPTTGGYPQIAVVERVDLPYLAQAQPGSGRVRFVEGDINQSQKEFRQLIKALKSGIIKPDEDWMWL